MAQGAGGLMVSVSGIRGRVGEALSPEVVARYASAFGAWSLAQGGSRRIVVGRDSRVSGPMVHRIVVGTLQMVGCDVIDIGLTTTPGCQLSVEHHHAAGGVMLSLSGVQMMTGSDALALQPALAGALLVFAAWPWAKPLARAIRA